MAFQKTEFVAKETVITAAFLNGLQEALIQAEEDVTALGKQAVSVSSVKSGNTVTVTAGYADGSTSVTTVTLDENGDPVSVAKDGVTCALTWEGFDG